VCGLLISSILIVPTISFADDYPRLDKAYPSGDKIIFVENNKYGLKDKDFFTIIDPNFDYIGPFEDGFSISRFNNKKGIIDSKGNVYIRNKYDDIIHLGNNNFLGLNIEPGNLKYIYIDPSKEEFLLNSYVKSYENGRHISQEFVGTMIDNNYKRSKVPSKSKDLYTLNRLIKNTEYYIVDDVQNEDFGQLKKSDEAILENKILFNISYTSNLNPVFEIGLWGNNLKEDQDKEVITIENLTLESLKYFTDNQTVSNYIFEDINYFMKSNSKGINQNKTYYNFKVNYEAGEFDSIKVTLRKQ
jgi:hypothetical protein